MDSLPTHSNAKTLSNIAHFLYRWTIKQTEAVSGNNLTFSQVSVLFQIRHGITTPGEIARALRVTPKAITVTVDGLIADGMVHRQSDANDRRKIQLRLTKRGFEASMHVELTTLAPLAAAILELPAREREELQRALDTIGSLTKALSTPDDPPLGHSMSHADVIE